jgi:hypothetical protein
MKWTVSVGVRVSIDYENIEADSKEEAKQIARLQAMEDLDVNNAEIDYDGVTVYCAYPTNGEDELELIEDDEE